MKEQKRTIILHLWLEVIIMDLKDSIATSGVGKHEETGFWDIVWKK